MARPRFEVVEESSAAFVARTFGEQGRSWLDALPSALASLAADWRLDLGPELRGGVLSCVREAVGSDGERLVLKVAGPWSRTGDEAAALEAWGGLGAPRLVRADLSRSALLLERVDPGTKVVDADPEAVAGLLRRLHLPVVPAEGGSSPSLGGSVRERLAAAVADSRAGEDRAEPALEALADLERDAPAPVLLHGDFDERNLLACARRGLAAIDPLPCVGDPAYDAATWAHANRRPGIAGRRAGIAAALGLDPARVDAWGEIVAVHG